MRFAIIAALAFLSIAFGAIDNEEGVLVLTDDNFDEAVGANSIMLVEFYAPWCGHCKSLAPEWAKAGKQLEGSEAKLAKLDATANKKKAEEYGIRGFPTIKFFRNGKVTDYNGGRTASEIVSWLGKKTGSVVKTVSSEDELKSLQENHDAIIIGLFASETSDNAKAFSSLASEDDSAPYVWTTSAEVKASLGVSSDSIVILKSFDDKRNDYAITGKLEATAAADFIAQNSVPLIQTFSQESAKKIFSSPVKVHALFFSNTNADHHAPTISTLSGIAKDYKGKALFINVPSSESRVVDYFGIKETELPAIILAEMGDDNMKKFPFQGELSGANVRAFMESYFAGDLTPHLKSEDVQADDTTQDVVVLRGKSFNDIVINNSKDVLVEFYAPWCGHCKKLAPTYEEVGRRLKGVDGIVIAKMDATANEVSYPGLAVKGYPSLYFFKGDDKAHPIRYEGGREADDFVEYLGKNSHNKFDHEEL